MRRSKVRFLLLMFAVALLVFLILFQQGISAALIRDFTGAIENQTAPVLVYSVDGQRVMQASLMTPELEAEVAAVPGVGEIGRLGVGTFTVTANTKRVDATIIGYERDTLGSPSRLVAGRLAQAANEVVATEEDRSSGFDLGDVVTVEPGGLALTVVGLASQSQLNVVPTLYTGYDTYVSAVASRNPDAGTPLPNVLALSPKAGVTPQQLVDAVNEVDLNLDALTRKQAAAKTPGVAQVRQSFTVIFVLYGLVVPLVTGLFFLIVTFQKANSLTLLRAIGAPSGRLVRSLLVQVTIVLVGGLAIGVAGDVGISQGRVGELELEFSPTAVIFWSVLLLALGIISSLVAAKRVLAIDPIAATTGAGVGR
jgi:putative ABC transport system permease protein